MVIVIVVNRNSIVKLGRLRDSPIPLYYYSGILLLLLLSQADPECHLFTSVDGGSAAHSGFASGMIASTRAANGAHVRVAPLELVAAIILVCE